MTRTIELIKVADLEGKYTFAASHKPSAGYDGHDEEDRLICTTTPKLPAVTVVCKLQINISTLTSIPFVEGPFFNSLLCIPLLPTFLLLVL